MMEHSEEFESLEDLMRYLQEKLGPELAAQDERERAKEANDIVWEMVNTNRLTIMAVDNAMPQRELSDRIRDEAEQAFGVYGEDFAMGTIDGGPSFFVGTPEENDSVRVSFYSRN